MVKSKALEEYIAQRCEEILERDNTYWHMIKQISHIHEALKLTLSNEQLKLLIDLENAIANTHAYVETLLYLQGVKDGVAIKNLTKNITHHCFL